MDCKTKKIKKENKQKAKKEKNKKNEFTPDVQNAADRCQSKQESMTDHRIQNAADFKQSKQYTKREVKRMKINGSQPRQLPCWLALLCLVCLPAQAASSSAESPVACTRLSPLEGSPGASFGGGLAAANMTLCNGLCGSCPAVKFAHCAPSNSTCAAPQCHCSELLAPSSEANIASWLAPTESDLWDPDSWDSPWSLVVVFLLFDFHVEIWPHFLMWSFTSVILLGRVHKLKRKRRRSNRSCRR